jgi:autotransporter translocation and assembly factor TamB
LKFDSKEIKQIHARIDSIKILNQDLGKLFFQVEKQKTTYDVNGYFSQKQTKNIELKGSILNKNNGIFTDLNLQIKQLDIHKFEKILHRYFKNFEGYIDGNVYLNGKVSKPNIKASIGLNNIKLQSVLRNSKLYINKQKIEIKDNTLLFNNLTVLDSSGNSFRINGKIKEFYNNNFFADFRINIDNYLFFDIPENETAKLSGKLIIDNISQVKGTKENLEIISDLTVKKGSQITYIYDDGTMQNKISQEGIVEFHNELKDTLNILDTLKKDWLSGMNLNARIKINKETKINFVLNKAAGEGLTVSGSGDLALNIADNGIVNLNGLFNVEKGNYELSYYGLVSREFKITKGPNIKWTGTVNNPIIDLTAKYKVKASPYPLMINTTDNQAELFKYKNAETFYVNLNIIGSAQRPEMKFEIDYPQVYENTHYPDVQTRINQINADEAAVNKQAMSLMIIGGFVFGVFRSNRHFVRHFHYVTQ